MPIENAALTLTAGSRFHTIVRRPGAIAPADEIDFTPRHGSGNRTHVGTYETLAMPCLALFCRSLALHAAHTRRLGKRREITIRLSSTTAPHVGHATSLIFATTVSRQYVAQPMAMSGTSMTAFGVNTV